MSGTHRLDFYRNMIFLLYYLLVYHKIFNACNTKAMGCFFRKNDAKNICSKLTTYKKSSWKIKIEIHLRAAESSEKKTAENKIFAVNTIFMKMSETIRLFSCGFISCALQKPPERKKIKKFRLRKTLKVMSIISHGFSIVHQQHRSFVYALPKNNRT